MSIFKKGFKSVDAEVKRQEENRAKMGNRIYRLFIKAKDEDGAQIRFLTEEPVTFYEHTIKRGGRFDNVLCVGEECSYCASGERPSYKGAFLVYDYRKYKAKDGKTKEGGLRLYVGGTRVLSSLMRIHKRNGGLKNILFQLDRDGEGTATTYQFSVEKKLASLSEEEVAGLLPEKLRETYDGSEESLMQIIEEQLEMSLNVSSSGFSDEEEDEEEDVESATLCNLDDEEDEDEEIAKPVKKGTPSLKNKLRKSKIV